MTRRFLVVGLALMACTPQTGYSRGGLLGAHDLALTDRYVFISSADTNDLKVLQLDVPNSPGQRTYVPAPNPLETLSIPVISRPTSLALDNRWVNGRVVHGSYLYVSRPGGSEMSIVGAERTEFRELTRLVSPAPVTSTVAVKLDANTSRLYFATFDGSLSTLYSLDLPADVASLRALAPAQLTSMIKLVVTFGTDTVVSMLVVPGLNGRSAEDQAFCDLTVNHCLAIAMRRASGTDGQTLLFDPVSLRKATMGYPGPVRYLVTNGQTVLPDGLDTPGRQAGERVWAILDEEKCGGASCGGVIAVDTVTSYERTGGFPVAKYGDGTPMLPLTFGDSLPVGLTISTNPSFVSRDGGPAVTRLQTINGDGGISLNWYAALGVATSANGQVTFFDTTTLQQIDGDDSRAHASNATFFDSTGYLSDWVTGLDAGTDVNLVAQNISVGDGVWRSQLVQTYWEGALNDAALPVAALATTLAVPQSLVSRLKLGDFVVFQSADTLCADASITAIGTDTVSIAAVPANCFGVISFNIRAGPAAPFAIFRTQVPKYLGRAAPGEAFVWNGAAPYVRLSGYAPSKPALTMGFGLDTLVTPVKRGSLWQVFIASAYGPYSFIVDPNSVGCSTQLPGQALFDDARARVYVLYPSSNSLIDVDPSLAQRGALGALQGTYCYH